jgi:hypothetical protein
MTTKDIVDAKRFEIQLMAERKAAGLCPRCGFVHHQGEEDDSACLRSWTEKVKRQNGCRADGSIVYPDFGLDGNS